MFTGIIETIGKIVVFNGAYLMIQTPKDFRVRLGDSVAVAGVCLTVGKIERRQVRFDLMKETLRKTALLGKKTGEVVNLERSLKAGDRIGGHFVYGHVDGVGEVTPLLAKEGLGEVLLQIKPPPALMIYIVPQGAVALDGASLTVARVSKTSFTVSLVPYTLKHTTLGALKPRDKVNIEVDMMAKYAKLGGKGNR